METGRLNDPGRLAALRRSKLLDSDAEDTFDRLSRLAQRLLHVPVALVSLVTDERQFFKSSLGLKGPVATTRETPLTHSFCQHVVAKNEPLIINDAPTHPLVCENLAIRDLGVISYIGFPIRDPDGHVLGSFCAIDSKPRNWTETDASTMRELAELVVSEIALRQANLSQRADDERLRKIAKQVPGMIYQFRMRPDGSYCFPYASEGIRSIYRVSPDEVRESAAGVFGIVHPDDLSAVALSIKQSAERLRPWRHEYRVKYSDGTQRWLLGDAIPEREPDGGTLWHGFITDVSERKNADQLLRSALDQVSRQQFAMDQHSIIAVTDLEGTITYANEKFCQISGYSEKELVGQNHRIIKSGFHSKEFFTDMYRTIARGKVWNGEVCNRAKSGHLYWVATTIVPFSGVDGTLERYVAIRTDVTAQKRDAELLRESEARFRLSFLHAGIGKAIVSSEGRWLEVNHTLCEMLGYSEAQLQKMTFQDITHADDRHIEAELTPLLLAGTIPVLRAEKRYVRPDGSHIWGRLTSVAVQPNPNLPAQFIVQIEDITALKASIEEKERINRKLAEAAKLESLGVLAGGIAHDFNNLLTGVLGNASLLRMELPQGLPQLNYIGQIENAGRRAAELCKQMLAYSGKGRFVIGKIDLNETVRETARLLEISISKNAVLRFNLTQNLPWVEADETQIRQVVMNLVINASEAIGERSGVIAINTGVTRVDENYINTLEFDQRVAEGEYVSLEVSDNGSGMDDETLKKIFDPFFTTKFTGRGLGLAAVQGIMRGHRGAIKVYSEVNKGSTFRLLFPCSDPVRQEVAAASPGSTTPWKGSGTVLIADDEETVRTVAARMFESMGFRVELACDGREAVEKFRLEPARFSLVFLDLTMPHQDGEDTFKQLRHIQPGVRVILTSGFNYQEIMTRFAGKGLSGFVQKPFESRVLADEVRKVCHPA